MTTPPRQNPFVVFCVLVSLGAVFPCTTSAAEPALNSLALSPAVQTVIADNEQALLKAVLAQDNAAVDDLLDADFVCVHENGLISTKEQFLRDFVAKGCTAADLTATEAARQYGGAIFTLNRGYFQWTGETPYPATAVTHIWVEKDGNWVLAHRHESHKGEPIGKQLPPEGSPNPTHDLGSKPTPDVAKIINEHEAGWAYAMIVTDVPRMDKLVDESLRYVHVTDHVSSKRNFMDELQTGFTETFFRDMTMRQFGDMVLVLHWARYRHTGKPEQSPSMVMHAWYLKNGEWVMVGRHGARFANY